LCEGVNGPGFIILRQDWLLPARQGAVSRYVNPNIYRKQHTKCIPGEAKSLELIEKAAPGLAPVVFKLGTIISKEDDEDENGVPQEVPFMISEYKFLQPLRGEHALALAKRLALELHAYKSEKGQLYSKTCQFFTDLPRLWVRMCLLVWGNADTRLVFRHLGGLLCGHDQLSSCESQEQTQVDRSGDTR
jgi:hypothetical protein